MTVNKVAVALAARDAMRDHRKDKPVAFSWPTKPSMSAGQSADSPRRFQWNVHRTSCACPRTCAQAPAR